MTHNPELAVVPDTDRVASKQIMQQHADLPVGLSYSFRFGLLIGSWGEGEVKHWTAC